MKEEGRDYTGPRVRIGRGSAWLLPPTPTPTGMLAGQFSVLSPGTERRHLEGPDRAAGYMTLGRSTPGQGWTVAPVPHGAGFRPDVEGSVTAPAGVSAAVAALARFQLMAALGIGRLPGGPPGQALVVGSGPVALGCALELHRRGVEEITVITGRRETVLRHVPGVRVEGRSARRWGLVVDACGRPGRATQFVAPGGVLGLLGTPSADDAVPALDAHRGGWFVIGMHELAGLTPGMYQSMYVRVANWLAKTVQPHAMALWCRTVPGADAPRFLRLAEPRPSEPVIVFDWLTPEAPGRLANTRRSDRVEL